MAGSMRALLLCLVLALVLTPQARCVRGCFRAPAFVQRRCSSEQEQGARLRRRKGPGGDGEALPRDARGTNLHAPSPSHCSALGSRKLLVHADIPAGVGMGAYGVGRTAMDGVRAALLLPASVPAGRHSRKMMLG